MVWYMTIRTQLVSTAEVNMCVVKYYIFIIALFVVNCFALNCRSDGGPKEEDLKKIYKSCLKMQEDKNSSDSRKFSGDQDWNESYAHNQRNQWDRDGRNNRDKTNNRDDRMGVRDRFAGKDDRMGRRDDRMGNRDDRMGNRDDRLDNRNDRVSGRDKMEGREDPMNNREDGMRGRNHDTTRYHDGGYQLNGRDDFQSDDYGSDMSRHNYYLSTQPSRRFRRDRHKEVNSGHRSQYNPNAQKATEHQNSYRYDEKNSTRNSSKDDDNKACALHCFLEHLEMIGDNGMPDKFLVTHAITKDVKNDDLSDFLQESIEECFQIIDNENTEDKCEFSKNLMLCLSEKGRANCDDWKDDLKF